MPVRDDHQELLIVKGVAPAKGDTASAEIGLTPINLLADEGEPGWSLNLEGGWIPKRASLKSGGTWADSAVSPGRTLVAGVDANVIETLQLTVTGTSLLDLAAQLTRMGRMRQAVIDFWTNPREIDPVFLHWYAREGAGAQYALIYALDIAEDEPDVWQQAVRDVTITIEREPDWRGLPPGANPKVWTHEIIRHVANWTGINLTLYNNQGASDDVNHALIGSAGGAAGNITNNDSGSSNNYVEISAANVPGDAPALLQLSLQNSLAQQLNTWYVAVRSEPYSYNNISGSFQCTQDASAATLGTDAATAADATVASGNRVNITPGTAADSLRLTFSLAVPIYQGRFAVYLRAYQNTGSAGDWRAHIEINAAAAFSAGFTTLILPEQQFSVGATQWPMVYMGEIELPMGIRTGVSSFGNGLIASTYSILVYARRTTGTSTLRFADLVLMPLDEGFAIVNSTSDNTSRQTDTVIDNTGYYGRGKSETFSAPIGVEGVFTNQLSQYGLCEYAGAELTLTPRKINRVYIIRSLADVTAGIPTATFGVRGNIIPRWIGVRDT
jgi:hypothetical protein